MSSRSIKTGSSKAVNSDTSPGRGWHGDPEGHAFVGSKGGQLSGGNFKHSPGRASLAGKKGGAKSSGNFKYDSNRAREAGRRGGLKSHKKPS